MLGDSPLPCIQSKHQFALWSSMGLCLHQTVGLAVVQLQIARDNIKRKLWMRERDLMEKNSHKTFNFICVSFTASCLFSISVFSALQVMFLPLSWWVGIISSTDVVFSLSDVTLNMLIEQTLFNSDYHHTFCSMSFNGCPSFHHEIIAGGIDPVVEQLKDTCFPFRIDFLDFNILISEGPTKFKKHGL